MAQQSDAGSAATVAAAASAGMIAVHVAGRAVRDGLFLSYFDLDALKVMFGGAAVFSLVVLLWTSRLMTRLSPGRFVPAAFAASGVLLIGEWALELRLPRVAAVALYLHMAGLGAFLVSGFWSIVNERFDPRTAKRKINLIAGGATLGGLLGGLGAERVAALSSVTALLPVLGLLHLACGFGVYLLCAWAAPSAPVRKRREPSGALAGMRYVIRSRYLRDISALVLLAGISATLLDFVFKARALERYGQGEDLTRFLALFYMAAGLATFGIQTTLGRRSLEKLGLGNTTALLPGVIGVGSLVALLIPGLPAVGLVRGSESAVRSSLFRSGYELLYTPVSLRVKRSAKAIIDVGVDRLADGAGALVLLGLGLLSPLFSMDAMLVGSFLLGSAALLTTRRIQRGYVEALRNRLVNQSSSEDATPALAGGTDSILMRTIGNLDVAALGQTGQRSRFGRTPASADERDSIVQAFADLRSGTPERVRMQLSRGLDPILVPQAISLLDWDAVSDDVITALRDVATSRAGELGDALLDPESSFPVRRRVPRILSESGSQRAVDVLLAGLGDHRFEVRYQCAAALSHIHERHPELRISSRRTLAVVREELRVEKEHWQHRHLMDSGVAHDEDPVLEGRRDLSLSHVFRLLSLVFEREPLRVACRGLHTDDPYLRGTAIEYLENVLPVDIFARLTNFLPGERAKPAKMPGSGRRDVRFELLQSRHSIEINLEKLKKV